jgi:hypothetical protein
MSLNPINELYSVYVNEVIEPQLGKSNPQTQEAPKGASGGQSGAGGAGGTSEKRIRQAVYDIRYRSRREDIGLDQAFSQYMSHTSMNASEKDAVKEKLGIGPGGSGVSEEYVDEELRGHSEKKFQVRVTDKLSGKTYVRYATRSKINKLRSNKNISSVEMTSYGSPYEGEKKGGKATADVTSGKGLARKDYDGDGNIESPAKEYRGSVHNAIQKKRGGKSDGQDTSNVKEGFSNWREDIFEIASGEDDNAMKSQIKEKKVKNKIVLNPTVGESVDDFAGIILDEQDITENFITEEVQIATEYFYEMGLNEYGIDIVIEELGIGGFVEWVDDIAKEYTLTEARSGGVKVEPVTAKGKPFKGGKPTKQSLVRLRKEKQARREAEAKTSQAKPSGLTASLRSQAATAAASDQKKSPRSSGSVKQEIGKRVAAAKDFVEKGVARHQQAVGDLKKKVEPAAQTAAKTAQTAGLAAKRAAQVSYAAGQHLGQTPAGKSVKKHGSDLLRRAGEAIKKRASQDTEKVKKWLTTEEFEFVVSYLIDEGYDISDLTVYDICEQLDLMEKSPPGFKKTVEKMKKHKEIDNPFALAWHMKKKGYKSHAESYDYDEVSIKKKVKESLDPKIVDQQQTPKDDSVRNTQSDAVKKQQLANLKKMQQKKQMLDRQRLQMQQANKLPLDHAEDFEMDGESIDEEMPKRARGSRPPGTRTFTGMGYYGRTAGEKKDPKRMNRIFPEPKEDKPEYDDENPPRRSRLDDHPSLSARERNPNLR